MQRQTERGLTEYPVQPEDVAAALSARATFQTGLLSPDILYVAHDGPRRLVCAYRRPRLTAVWLDGSQQPLKAPLPGLILIRSTTGASGAPAYRLWASKRRPTSLDAPLYHAPLPNLYFDGAICWGTVALDAAERLAPASLDADFATLLGSSFSNHGCHGKSSKYPDDVRRLLIELDQQPARRYPTTDLIPARRTLGEALGVGGQEGEDEEDVP